MLERFPPPRWLLVALGCVPGAVTNGSPHAPALSSRSGPLPRSHRAGASDLRAVSGPSDPGHDWSAVEHVRATLLFCKRHPTVVCARCATFHPSPPTFSVCSPSSLVPRPRVSSFPLHPPRCGVSRRLAKGGPEAKFGSRCEPIEN